MEVIVLAIAKPRAPKPRERNSLLYLAVCPKAQAMVKEKITARTIFFIWIKCANEKRNISVIIAKKVNTFRQREVYYCR